MATGPRLAVPAPQGRGRVSAGASWSEIERLFVLAVAHEPGERDAILDQACSEPIVRREVESLLLADEQASGFLDVPLPPTPGPGERIGPYRLIRKLGEGETSTVYLAARDDDQYRQHVAIKLIRPGMDSRQILQRFHRERQILASLSHANIARLLDGGSTPAGQPYFVMEHIEGEPLDVHCQARQLPLARRLELFGLVCQAVHFAHQNLVVHRDLKPGNILVDAGGAPKLLDFGIAKLLDPERAGIDAEPTGTVARLMTPHYASPEQVQGKPISTASDVYSLGVILYKLLTRRRPYELESQSLHEIERVVCESTPPPPSHVLRARRGDRIPRDLDNIVAMAMRKEPARRYASAQELADDVRRCLERRPVLARRDTLGYRISSFVRRNTGAVAAAALIFLVLLGGAAATTWQWRRAVAERSIAEAQRMTAQQTLDFVVELFKVPESATTARETTARELLDRGATHLRDDTQHPPHIRAALQHTLGVVYLNLGEYQRATPLLEEAVAARSLLPGNRLELADSLYQLGAVSVRNGKFSSAERLLQRALTLRARVLGADNDLGVANVLDELAVTAIYKVAFHEAEDHLRRALAVRRRHLGEGNLQLIPSLMGLATLYYRVGHYEQAETLLREGLEIRRRTSGATQCFSTVAVDNVLGLLRGAQGYFEDAERYIDAAIECLQRELGDDHIEVVDLTSVRIAIWCEQGRYAEAEELARQNLARRRALYGDHHPAVDHGIHYLARVLYERGELAEADQLATSALAMREGAYGRAHDAVAQSLALLARIQLARADAKTAEASSREALTIWQRALGDEHPILAGPMRDLAEALVAQGRLGEAKPMAEAALALQRRRLRPGHPEIAATLAVLGAIAQAASPASAEPLLREALAIQRTALRPEHPHTARVESLLGECLWRQQKLAEALPLLRHAAQTLRSQLGDDHAEAQLAWRRLLAAEPPSPG